MTRDEFFGVDDEDDAEQGIEQTPSRNLKWIKVTVASLLAIVLLTNILAFWPQVYNVAAIKFLIKSRELSKNEAVQMYKEAVVEIKTGQSSGTGFNISSDGLIVTNDHVVAESVGNRGNMGNMLRVGFPAGKSYPATIVLTRPDIDIAILKVDTSNHVNTNEYSDSRDTADSGGQLDGSADGRVDGGVDGRVGGQLVDALDFPTLELKFDHTVADAEPVYIIGNPLLFRFIANEGQVIGTIQLQEWDQPVLVIDAPIYKGNSGSPVINMDGKVIGVVFATTRIEYNGSKKKVGLAIPVDYMRDELEQFAGFGK